MDAQFFQSLPRISQILYKTSYDFEMKYCNGTPESAHRAGLSKLQNVEKMRKREEAWVNLVTGEKVEGRF